MAHSSLRNNYRETGALNSQTSQIPALKLPKPLPHFGPQLTLASAWKTGCPTLQNWAWGEGAAHSTFTRLSFWSRIIGVEARAGVSTALPPTASKYWAFLQSTSWPKPNPSFLPLPSLSSSQTPSSNNTWGVKLARWRFLEKLRFRLVL
jgi:hypothetical protein